MKKEEALKAIELLKTPEPQATRGKKIAFNASTDSDCGGTFIS